MGKEIALHLYLLLRRWGFILTKYFQNVKDNYSMLSPIQNSLWRKQRKTYFGSHAYRLYLLCDTKRGPTKCAIDTLA